MNNRIIGIAFLGSLIVMSIVAVSEALVVRRQIETDSAKPTIAPTRQVVATTPQPTKTPPGVYTLLGYAEKDNLIQVEQTALQMIAAGTNARLAYQVWALSLLDHDKYSEAYSILDEASQAYPEEAWFPFLTGQAAYHMGEFQISRQFFTRVIELGNNSQLMKQSADWFQFIEKAAGQ